MKSLTFYLMLEKATERLLYSTRLSQINSYIISPASIIFYLNVLHFASNSSTRGKIVHILAW